MTTSWKYTDATKTVVQRELDNGMSESCIVGREDVKAWVIAGGVIVEPDEQAPIEPTLDEKVDALLKGGKTLDDIKAKIAVAEAAEVESEK